MHNNALERLVEDICNPRADIGEKADGISDEIGGSQNPIQLAQDFLAIVIENAVLEVCCGQPHVLDSQCVHLQRGVVDVPYSHRQGIQDHCQWVSNAQPGRQSEHDEG